MFSFFFLLTVNTILISAQFDTDCGKGTMLRNRRIIGGSYSRKGHWGWQAILKYKGNHKCGGSIIKDDWILTAAHCISDGIEIDSYTVDVGVNDQKKPDPWSIIDIRISKIIIHPYYNDKTFANDIALIKLKKNIHLDKNDFKIIPICLADNIDLTGKISFATGFGLTDPNRMLASNFIKQVMLPVLDDYSCQNSFKIDCEIQFCAGDNLIEKNTCRGDSGGPLVIKSRTNGRWYLVGITSWGYNCGGVYTRVGYFKDWIVNSINKNDSVNIINNHLNENNF